MRWVPALVLAFFLNCLLHAMPATAADAFERIAPAQAGYSDEGLKALEQLLTESGSESMLLLHEGKVFFEWGDIRRKRLVHSIRKPLLHALVGVELEKGNACFNGDSTVAELGLDERPPGLTAQEKSATLRQLFQSRSGIYHPAAAESEGMQSQRPARGSHAPGEYFYYNNWDFNAVGEVYRRCTGRGIHEAFLADIAAPLGMLDYQARIYAWTDDSQPPPEVADGFRRLEPEKSRYGAYHFRLSAHDLALFGQLYLDHGRWQGRQLLQSQWLDDSLRPISMIEPEYGLAYGQLWNVLVPGPGEERPSFYHTGVGVHMLGVYPRHGLVMVHRVNTEQASDFVDGNLYRIIRAMHAARLTKHPPRRTL
ncbi:serine hydrolase domain-containing protein [Arenimonas sp. MALMAid1274]|uniref:serine hydrolase domain-containing protein n=1 Tax=Arenimonas sp. MALMAid1274 TaxID=3411630 RepID=UPI003B9FAAC8